MKKLLMKAGVGFVLGVGMLVATGTQVKAETPCAKATCGNRTLGNWGDCTTGGDPNCEVTKTTNEQPAEDIYCFDCAGQCLLGREHKVTTRSGNCFKVCRKTNESGQPVTSISGFPIWETKYEDLGSMCQVQPRDPNQA